MSCCACSASTGHTFAVLFGRVYYRHLASILALVYLFIGMFIFSAVEGPREQEVGETKQRNQLDSIETMVIDLANLSINNETLVNWTILSIVAPDPSQPLQVAVTLYRVNHSCVENDRSMKSSSLKWNQAGSWFFSLTVLTTVGYGNLAPETAIGKLLCVVYASIGIPLLQIALDHARNLFIFLTVVIEKRFTCSWYRGAHDTDQISIENIENQQEDLLRNPKPWTLIVVFLAYINFYMIPSAFFTFFEGWDYGTSLYYNFVTLSTIGFGDLIAGANAGGAGTRYNSEWEVSIYRFVISTWMLFGLTFAAGVFQIVRLQLEKLLKFITSWRCYSSCMHRRRYRERRSKENADTSATETAQTST